MHYTIASNPVKAAKATTAAVSPVDGSADEHTGIIAVRLPPELPAPAYEALESAIHIISMCMEVAGRGFACSLKTPLTQMLTDIETALGAAPVAFFIDINGPSK